MSALLEILPINKCFIQIKGANSGRLGSVQVDLIQSVIQKHKVKIKVSAREMKVITKNRKQRSKKSGEK